VDALEDSFRRATVAPNPRVASASPNRGRLSTSRLSVASELEAAASKLGADDPLSRQGGASDPPWAPVFEACYLIPKIRRSSAIIPTSPRDAYCAPMENL